MDKNKFLLGIMIALIGLFMMVAADAFIKFAVIILGIAAVLDGIFILYTAKNLIIDENYAFIMKIRGCMSIVVGFLAVFLPLVFAAVLFTIMDYTLAAYLLISAGLEVYTIDKLKRNGYAIRQSVIEVISSIILAIVLFLIPSETMGRLIVGIAGLALIVTGLVMAFVQWRNRPLLMDASVSEEETAPTEESINGEAASQMQDEESSSS